jgi:YHS domain-containing protein
MQLKMLESDGAFVSAGYDCPCGCTPSLAYDRGGSVVRDDCCCGNTFALGPDSAVGLGQRPGFIPEHQVLVAPWNEALQAAWLVGPSRHGSEAAHDHDHHAHGAAATTAVDPVCGMTVEIERARAAGLHANHEGADYYFCGRGCLLDFGEDPQRYLAPGYLPAM